jgi:succinate dehydrogenase / fumarate reductase membrane anchor subunit
MVTNVTSLSRNGLSDWMIQRVSAVVLGLYAVVMAGYFATSGDINYFQWYQFMMSTPMKIFSMLAFISLAAHAWIGLWTIATDYIKPTAARFVFQWVCILLNVSYVIWAGLIFWG